MLLPSPLQTRVLPRRTETRLVLGACLIARSARVVHIAYRDAAHRLPALLDRTA